MPFSVWAEQQLKQESRLTHSYSEPLQSRRSNDTWPGTEGDSGCACVCICLHLWEHHRRTILHDLDLPDIFFMSETKLTTNLSCLVFYHCGLWIPSPAFQPRVSYTDLCLLDANSLFSVIQVIVIHSKNALDFNLLWMIWNSYLIFYLLFIVSPLILRERQSLVFQRVKTNS